MKRRNTASRHGVADKIIPEPKLLSFDVFGTLIDVRSGSRAAFERILAEAGGGEGRCDPLELWEQWEKANIRRYWDRTYHSYREICRASLQEVFSQLHIAGNPDSIQFYFDSFAQFKRFPDVDAVLDALGNAGYKLAVVSNIDDDAAGHSIGSYVRSGLHLGTGPRLQARRNPFSISLKKLGSQHQ